MARITPCLENGKTAYVSILADGEVAFGSTEYIVFRAKTGISDALFVYYLVRSDAVRLPAIKSMVGSSGRQRVQLGVLDTLRLKLPPLLTQRKIAAILSSLDDKIENNNAICRNLEEQAEGLFHYYCRDVYGKSQCVRENYRAATVGDVINVHDSQRVPLSKLQRSSRKKIYPYYGATEIMDYVDEYLFDGVYLLLAEDGSVMNSEGYPVLQYVEGKFWVNNHAHVLSGRSGFSVELLYLLFNKMPISKAVTGAVQLKINQQNLRSLPIVLPTIETISKLDSLVQPLFEKIRALRRETANLISLRDSLLPKLMRGEIDVDKVSI